MSIGDCTILRCKQVSNDSTQQELLALTHHGLTTSRTLISGSGWKIGSVILTWASNSSSLSKSDPIFNDVSSHALQTSGGHVGSL